MRKTMKKASGNKRGSARKFDARRHARNLLTMSAASAAIAAMGKSAHATTEYWDANTTAGHGSVTSTWDAGTTAQWGDSAGTATLTTWTNGNDAQFDTGGTNGVTISGTVAANSINYSANNTIVNIGGGTLQLGAGGLVGANNATLSIGNTTALQLSGNQTWNQSGGGLTVNSAVTETGAGNYTLTLSAGSAHVITVGGAVNIGSINSNSANITSTFSNNVTLANTFTNTAGTVTLGGSNSFGNGLILVGGTTNVSADANMGTAGQLVNFNGGTLQINGTSLTNFSGSSHVITFTAAQTVGVNIGTAANTFTIDKVLNETTGGLTKTGLGSLTLNQNNTYTGTTSITDGTVTLDYSTNAGAKLGNNGVLTLNGATLTNLGIQAAPEIVKGLAIGAGSTLGNPLRSSFTGNGTYDFSSGTFTHTTRGVIAFGTSGGPIVKLAGTAGTIIGAGFATIGDNYVSVDASKVVTAFTAYNTNSFTANNNTDVTASGNWSGTTINSLHVSGPAATITTITGTGNITSGGILVSSAVGGNLTTITGGTLSTVSNGDLIVTQNNSGTLEIDSTLNLGSGSLVKSGTGGGNLKLASASTLSGTAVIYDGTVEFAPASGTTFTMSGAVVGAGGIIKSGLGTLSMSSGATTYAGPTTIKNGVLSQAANNVTFGNGNGLVTLGDTSAANTTAVGFSNLGRTFTNPFATAGTGGTNTLQSQGSGQTFAFTGGFTLGNNLTLSTWNGTDSITVSSGGISGNGSLTTSVSTVSSGGPGGAAGTSGSSGGTIAISSSVSTSGNITNNGSGTAGVTISGNISNAGNIVQNSAGSSLTLSGTNTGFSGGVQIGAGSLLLGSTAALNSANVVSIASGAGNVLDLSGNSQTIAGLNDITNFTGGSVINSGTAGKTLTLGGSGNYTFSGVYSGGTNASTPGTGALTVAITGNGSQSLSGNNLYTGATLLTSGTLNVNGAAALGNGTVTLNGGTLDNTSGSAITLSNNQAITLGGNFNFSNSSGNSSNNLNLGTGAITNAGSRTITLNGTGTTLTLGGVMTNGVAGVQMTTVNGVGNTLALGGYILSSTAGTPRTDIFNGNGSVTITGPVSDVTSGAAASGLTYSGTGALALAANNTFTGPLSVNSGTVILSGNNSAATGTTNVANGATLQLNTNSNAIAGSALTLNPGSTLQLRADGNTTFAAASLANTPNGSITIDVNQATSGNSSKTLTLSNAFTITPTSTFNVTGGNNYTLGLGAITGAGSSGDAVFNVASGVGLKIASFTGSAAGNDGILVSGAGNTTFAGALLQATSGSRNLTLNIGSVGGITGVVTLSGANWAATGSTGSGFVVLNSGTLALNNTAALGATFSNLTVNGGTLDATVAGISNTSNPSETWNGNFSFTGTNNLNMGSGTVTVGGNSTATITANTLTVGAVAVNGSTLTKAGAGTLTAGSVVEQRNIQSRNGKPDVRQSGDDRQHEQQAHSRGQHRDYHNQWDVVVRGLFDPEPERRGRRGQWFDSR